MDCEFARATGGAAIIRLAALTVVTLAIAIGLSGCSRSAGAPQTPPAAGEKNPWQRTALWVEQGGVTRPFENGATVSIGDLNIEIFVAPYPPLREGSIDLYLTEKATGAPANAGSLRIVFDMYMPHGSLRAQALPTGGGHFLVPYLLVMPGEWRLDISVTHGSDVVALALLFKVE